MKKIMIIMVMCLVLVGCGKDYGIFTKEGYDLLTDTEREEVTKSFQSLFEIKRKIDLEEYESAMSMPFYQTCSSSTSIQKEISTMYSVLMQDLYVVEDAVKMYDEQYNNLKKYISDDNVGLIDISDNAIKGILEFRYAIK